MIGVGVGNTVLRSVLLHGRLSHHHDWLHHSVIDRAMVVNGNRNWDCLKGKLPVIDRLHKPRPKNINISDSLGFICSQMQRRHGFVPVYRAAQETLT